MHFHRDSHHSQTPPLLKNVMRQKKYVENFSSMEFHESPEKCSTFREHMLKMKLIRTHVWPFTGTSLWQKLCGSNVHALGNNWLQILPRARGACCLYSQFSSFQNLVKLVISLVNSFMGSFWKAKHFTTWSEQFEKLSTSSSVWRDEAIKLFHYTHFSMLWWSVRERF